MRNLCIFKCKNYIKIAHIRLIIVVARGCERRTLRRLPWLLFWSLLARVEDEGGHDELRTPQDREGRFCTRVFVRYRRTAKALATRPLDDVTIPKLMLDACYEKVHDRGAVRAGRYRSLSAWMPKVIVMC